MTYLNDLTNAWSDQCWDSLNGVYVRTHSQRIAFRKAFNRKYKKAAGRAVRVADRLTSLDLGKSSAGDHTYALTA